MDGFRMFSGLHALVLASILALTALAIVAGRRAGNPRPVERAIGWAYVAAWVTTYGFLLFPPLHEPAKTYPLQVCHLAALAAAALLVTRREWLRPLVYFWGLARLCTRIGTRCPGCKAGLITVMQLGRTFRHFNIVAGSVKIDRRLCEGLSKRFERNQPEGFRSQRSIHSWKLVAIKCHGNLMNKLRL